MPTASEIIERVKARYAGCRTYQDEGEQVRHFEYAKPDATHQPHTNRLKFRTAFERGGRFFFEYRGALLDEPEAEWTRGVIWSDGTKVRRYWSIPSPFETNNDDNDLDLAIAGFTGVSGGTAHEITSLLFGMPNARIATLGTAAVWPSSAFEGSACVGLGAAWPTRNTSIVVWIDEVTFLVRRIDEEHHMTPEYMAKMHVETRRRLQAEVSDPAKAAWVLRRMEEPDRQEHPEFTTKTTTVWHPRMDHDIDPKVFEFVEPG